jgi:D-beta-D-heptose 7-phosphate kinase/D-beta-D-heptose 1-phosphate adenosyltransferase
MQDRHLNYSISKHTGSPVELVRDFRGLRALVVGDVMLDTYLEGTATRLCSEGPVPVVAKNAEYRLPGGAANSAANLHALGAEVELLGVVGQDLAGSLLRQALHDYGISAHRLIESPDIITQHKLRIMANGQYVVRFDEGGTRESVAKHAHADEQRLLAHFDELYHWCDLVVVADYGYGAASERFIERLRVLQDSEPKIVLIDSKCLQRFRAVRATIVTPNFTEACELLERMSQSSQTYEQMSSSALEQIGQQLLAVLRCEYIAITLGARGVCIYGRDEIMKHIPASATVSVSDVGAGDSFTSAMALALAAGGSIEEAAKIGADAAGIAISRQRTTVVRYQELLQRVSVREYIAGSAGGVGDSAYDERYELIARLEEKRAQGKIVVFTNGMFDVLHAGHVQFLRQAKALGDVLVVGINSDRSVERLKGRGRPISSGSERKALVAALDMVDEVVLFDEDTPIELIRVLRPAIHVKGGDYVNEALPEAEAVQASGGRIVILPLTRSKRDDADDRVLAVKRGETKTFSAKGEL